MVATEVIDVLIASPGDALSERCAVRDAIQTWNGQLGERRDLMLRPRMWEIDAVALSGQGGCQDVINEQLVDACQIVFGIFKHRLGTPTPVYASGTVEEVMRSLTQRKEVHLYFSAEPAPDESDQDQLDALEAFKADMSKNGLLGSFRNVDELKLKVFKTLNLDVSKLHRPSISALIGRDARGNIIEDINLPTGMGLVGRDATDNVIRRINTTA